MPIIVRQSDQAARSVSMQGISLAAVIRTCTLQPYTPRTVGRVRVSSEIIAYASPDSTYAVTRKLLDSAKGSIKIAIYDFTATYIRDLLLQAMRRGVKVSLMLDLDNRDGETPIYNTLHQFGATTVPAPSCASKHSRYFPSMHSKVIVIDGLWTMIQSGNYSENSIPFNEVDGGDPANFVSGNRDMGIAIKSKPLARFFTQVIESDMKLELDGASPRGLELLTAQPVFLVEAAPTKLPDALFPSRRFNPEKAINVTPVLSPDNYMGVVARWLENARHSVLIEQQYIRAEQEGVSQLLEAIQKASTNNPDLDVRIVLGKVFSSSDIPKEKANLELLRKRYGLRLGTHIRYIDTDRFVHCHNKTIILDGESVLVSSQNWSSTGVGSNREAGVVVEFAPLAAYYAGIFESDWRTARKTLSVPTPESIGPTRLRSGNYIAVNYGDYAEL